MFCGREGLEFMLRPPHLRGKKRKEKSKKKKKLESCGLLPQSEFDKTITAWKVTWKLVSAVRNYRGEAP